jgi:hypothetical protein
MTTRHTTRPVAHVVSQCRPGTPRGARGRRELEGRALASVPVSASSLLRILAENPVKPWQYQSGSRPRSVHQAR